MKKIWIGIFVLALFLGGCSSGESEDSHQAPAKAQPKSTEEEQQVTKSKAYVPKEVKYFEMNDLGRELTDLERELLRKPGLYSGEEYDEAEVQKVLDQLPDNLTAEQYLEELKYLFTEDYHEELETLLQFDPNVEVKIDQPSGSVEEPKFNKVHFAILVDASGSMKALSGKRTRMDAAKEAIMEFSEQIPEEATLSLRVYGQKGTGSDGDKELSCSSTETVYKGSFDKEQFEKSLQTVQPAGWTPIGLALEKVKEDIPEGVDDVIVYVVSDGVETCGGDPAKAANQLATADIETVVNIIGFDVDDEGKNLLKDVAAAGNGEFTYVNSQRDLKEFMRDQYEEMKLAWIEWKKQGQLETIKVKKDKTQLAIDTKRSMVEKAVREKQRMESAQIYLKKKFTASMHPISDVYSLVSTYGASKYQYAEENGSRAYLEAEKSGTEQFEKYNEVGSEKIKELNGK